MTSTAHVAHRGSVRAHGDRFVAGEGLHDAARVVHRLHDAGIDATVGRFAPVARTGTTAVSTATRYADVAASLSRFPAGTRLEIDLPHIGLDVSPTLAGELLLQIGDRLPPGTCMQIGAEDSSRTDRVVDTVITAHRRGLPVRATIQANLRRSPVDLDLLVSEGVPVRLVKGGFRETPGIALTEPAEIDARIRLLAATTSARGADLSVATHDGDLQAWTRGLDPAPGLEMLLGVLPGLARVLAAEREVRVYVPFGTGGEDYVAKRLADERDAQGGRRC